MQNVRKRDVRVDLLQGPSMNIGQFLAGINSTVPTTDSQAADLFPSSINAKLEDWKTLVLGTETEQLQRKRLLGSGIKGMYVTFGLVKYMQDKWGLQLDLISNYTGAVPDDVVQMLKRDNDRKGSDSSDTNKQYIKFCPDEADIWRGLLSGKSIPNVEQGRGHRVDCFLEETYAATGLDGSVYGSVFTNPMVYVELDPKDTSDVAVMVRSSAKGLTSGWERLPVHKEKDEDEVYERIYNYRRLIHRLRGCSETLILAPKASFNTSVSLQERMVADNDLMREYCSGEWHMRRREQRMHKSSKDEKVFRALEAVAAEGVLPKRKPAKDPVLLRLIAGGFVVMAAWNNEADDIYDLGSSLKLI